MNSVTRVKKALMILGVAAFTLTPGATSAQDGQNLDGQNLDCIAQAQTTRRYGQNGQNGQNGRSGRSGQNGENRTLFLDDSLSGGSVNLNLAGTDGQDGEDGRNGRSAVCASQPRVRWEGDRQSKPSTGAAKFEI
jgi:hypothetical protein